MGLRRGTTKHDYPFQTPVFQRVGAIVTAAGALLLIGVLVMLPMLRASASSDSRRAVAAIPGPAWRKIVIDPAFRSEGVAVAT
jgi:hypothetical protein